MNNPGTPHLTGSAVAFSNGLNYLDVTPYFDGHEPCGGNKSPEAITRITDRVIGVAAFHPNSKGVEYYAQAVNDFINEIAKSGDPLTPVNLPSLQYDFVVPTAFAPNFSNQFLKSTSFSSNQLGSIGQSGLSVVAQTTPTVPTLDLGTVTVSGTNPCQNNEVLVGGQSMTLRADGFSPNATVSIQAVSQATDFAVQAAVADASGVVTTQVVVPTVQAGTVLTYLVTGPGQLGIERTDIGGFVVDGLTPCVTDDVVTVLPQTETTIAVLSNDVAKTGTMRPESVVILDQPKSGTVGVNADGTVTFRSSAGATGNDFFTYSSCDQGGCKRAQVRVTVRPGCTITGTSGNDTLQGTPGDDIICGGSGDDVISAGGGNDTVYGESGHDVIYGEGGNDRLYGGTGDDIVLGGDGDDQLLAGAERRDLNAGEPSEVLQLDETPPTVTISNPADQVIVAVGDAVPLTYTCADDTAIRSCSGTVPFGQLLDTSKPGTRTVQVTATDTAGNFATASLVYNVIANVDAVRTTGGNLTINGASNKIFGPVTSNGDVRLTGAGNTTYASVRYVGTISNVGVNNQFQVSPVKIATPDPRTTTTIDQWRPGTPNANALSADFKDMTANCAAGVWAPTAPLASGVYYSPCDVRISSGPTGPVTIISEKRISITTAGATWKPKAPAISLLSGSTDPTAISVAGAGSTFTGEILAPNGTITISGANLKLQCGVTAKAILLNGAGNQYSNTCA